MIIHHVELPRSIVPYQDLIAVIKIFIVLRKVRPHIVHLSTPKAALLGAFGTWIARSPNRIFLIRGLTSEARTGWTKKFYEALESLTARFCNVHLCVSKSLLKQARNKGILRIYEGEVVGPGMSNGVDCDRFSLKNVEEGFDLANLRKSLRIPISSKIIGYVGRLTKDKGLCELLETWKILKSKFPALYLLLVGEWRKQEQGDVVPSHVRTFFENDDRVRITGYVDHAAPYYALMTVLAFPSHREGFPNAPMEAAAMELPVVATRVTGCVDAVVDGETGSLVRPRDAEAMASAIAKYLSDPDLCKRHGKAGRERTEEFFRPEIIWNALLKRYRELVAPKDN